MTAPRPQPLDPATLTEEEKDDLQTRLWDRLDKTDSCWNWLGTSSGVGYGHLSFKGVKWRAHRLAWSLVNGPIPPGMLCCHKCDNRKCCNPEHIFIGTPLDNNLDAVAKGRHRGPQKTHCIRGHEYTPENTINRSCGQRQCRECERQYNKRRNAMVGEQRRIRREAKKLAGAGKENS